MTDPAHTPGPWRVSREGLLNRPLIRSPEEPNSKHGLVICEVFGYCADNTDANAALIAAAPDLLAACEAALRYLEANRPKGPIRTNFHALNEHENGVCKPLRAAISKARG